MLQSGQLKVGPTLEMPYRKLLLTLQRRGREGFKKLRSKRSICWQSLDMVEMSLTERRKNDKQENGPQHRNQDGWVDVHPIRIKLQKRKTTQ